MPPLVLHGATVEETGVRNALFWLQMEEAEIIIVIASYRTRLHGLHASAAQTHLQAHHPLSLKTRHMLMPVPNVPSYSSVSSLECVLQYVEDWVICQQVFVATEQEVLVALEHQASHV